MTMKRIICIFVCLALLLAVAGCAKKNDAPAAADNPQAQNEPAAEPTPAEDSTEAPVITPVPEDEAGSMPDIFSEPVADSDVFVSDGMKLSVPSKYSNLVQVGMGSALFGADGLFSVREIASMEAGEKQHPGEDWGEGALFGIGRMSEAEVHELMCGYLNNEHIFAKDADGNYYVFYQPTDVRFCREDMTNLQNSPDLEQWSALNEWAAGVPEQFIEYNGLEKFAYGGTDVEMMLSRIAYRNDTYFEFRSLDYGELYPDTPEHSAEYAKKLMDGVKYEYCGESETPDGEYYVIDFPNDGVRLDFFKGGDYVRADYGDYSTLLRITAPSAGYCVDVLRQWNETLQKNGG